MIAIKCWCGTPASEVTSVLYSRIDSGYIINYRERVCVTVYTKWNRNVSQFNFTESLCIFSCCFNRRPKTSNEFDVHCESSKNEFNTGISRLDWLMFVFSYHPWVRAPRLWFQFNWIFQELGELLTSTLHFYTLSHWHSNCVKINETKFPSCTLLAFST